MTESASKSQIASLLSGISWEGKKVTKKYRQGGRGVEEVLTTEVLLGLGFLPRKPFFENLVKHFMYNGSGGPFLTSNEVESFDFCPIPSGRHALKPDAETHQAAIDVQFDAMAQTCNSRIFIEAKRIGTSSFQEEQLARTFLIALRESDDLVPRVLLLLGSPPPVKIKKVGRVDVKEGILARLGEVYEKTDYLDLSLEEAESRIDECVAWITWNEIKKSIERSMQQYENPDPSTYAAVKRVAEFVKNSIEWHH
jgi:hypothetical protein